MVPDLAIGVSTVFTTAAAPGTLAVTRSGVVSAATAIPLGALDPLLVACSSIGLAVGNWRIFRPAAYRRSIAPAGVEARS